MSQSGLSPASEPRAHPLAAALAKAISARASAEPLLLLGVGSGRNIPILLGTGAALEAIEADAMRARLVSARFGERLRVTHGDYAGPFSFARSFAGALSTHALLHGTRDDIARAVAAVRDSLAPRGLLYATLGSSRDPRCGRGRQIEAQTFAPEEGSERGVPHTYLREADVRSLLAGFEIDALTEGSAAETAGSWAHARHEATELVHWFVRASVL